MSGAAPSHTRWPLLAGLVGCGVIAAFQVGKVPPALPALRDTFALSLVASGWIISMLALVAALGGAGVGSVIDRFGARRLVVTSFSIMALGSVLGAASIGATTLLASRALEGLGFLGATTALPTLIVRFVSRRDRGLAMGLWGAYIPTGIAISMLLAPPLMVGLGWRGLWVAGGALHLAAAVALARALPPDSARRAASTAVRDLLAVAGTPAPWLIGLCMGLFAAQHLTILAYLPLWLIEHRGVSLLAAGALAALATAVNIPGNVAGGWLLRRGVPGWSLIAGAAVVMGVSGVGVFAEALSDAARFGCVLLLSAVGGVVPASVFDAVPRHAPSPTRIGTTNGVVIQLNQLAQLGAPPGLAAAVAYTGGWQVAPWLLAGASLALAAAALGLRHVERSRVPA